MISPSPDRVFLKDLKSMDSRLSMKFNGNHFVVCYDRGYGEPVNIHRAKADDGGFRQPDQRDLRVIKGGDLAEGDSLEQRLKKTAYISEKMREKLKANARDNIRNMTKDDKNQLQKAFIQKTNQSKGNAAFRRITPKKKAQSL